jgi:hypothetical protein
MGENAGRKPSGIRGAGEAVYYVGWKSVRQNHRNRKGNEQESGQRRKVLMRMILGGVNQALRV